MRTDGVSPARRFGRRLLTPRNVVLLVAMHAASFAVIAWFFK